MSAHCFWLLAIWALAIVGCAPQQTPQCQAYVDCQRAYEAAFELNASDLQEFESEGECWSHPKTANDCDALCTAQMRSLFDAANEADVRLESCVLE